LVLFKPYILSKRFYDYQSLGMEEFNKYYILREIADKYLSWGVTPETYKHLSVIDLMYDSPKYANNRKPKPWMESFKQLNVDYRDSNTHSKEEYTDYLKRIDEMKRIIYLIYITLKFLLLKKINIEKNYLKTNIRNC